MFFPIEITLMEMLILFTQIELNLKAYANNLSFESFFFNSCSNNYFVSASASMEER